MRIKCKINCERERKKPTERKDGKGIKLIAKSNTKDWCGRSSAMNRNYPHKLFGLFDAR